MLCHVLSKFFLFTLFKNKGFRLSLQLSKSTIIERSGGIVESSGVRMLDWSATLIFVVMSLRYLLF